MTECERIIAEGILPESFFEEEVRCDFLVTKERKKIWAVELDLLLKFDEVCKSHNLRYYLSGGSLLGAIRHKGFIPWDDDIDIVMPREDYQRFLILEDEFKHPYFLQMPQNDKGYYFSFAKLRNSNTTCVSEKLKYNSFNQGIFIDIFPLDLRLPSTAKAQFNEMNQLLIDLSTWMKINNPLLGETDVKRVKSLNKKVHPMTLYNRVQSLAQIDKDTNAEHLSVVMATMYSWDKLLWRKEDFSDICLASFENHLLPVPAGYDRILSTQFGDYVQYPPVEKRGTWHSGVIFDPDNPYTKYIVK